MRTKHVFEFQTRDGSNFIDLQSWARTLPKNECDEFFHALDNQLRFRQEAIDRGDLEVVNDGYIWKDEETAKRGKEWDNIWLHYFTRWLDENNIEFIKREESC